MKSAPNAVGLILCAGAGARARLGYNKILYYIGKRTILETVIEKFLASHVSRICLVIAPCDEMQILDIIKQYNNIAICHGGDTRTESVQSGLKQCVDSDIVVIHDGARPYISPEIINNSIASAAAFGSGIVAVPTVDTIKEVSGGNIVRTLPRVGLYNIQTPQSFRLSEIVDAYNKVSGAFNDDSEVYERAGYTPKIVAGDYSNIKVTTTEDLFRIPNTCKIGVGFDVHELLPNLPLVVGGALIPHYKGLKGHSDADVLTHAIMDALLSAAGLVDIGVLFSDKDPAYKGISSLILLERVMLKVKERQYKVSSISAVIMAQLPKMAPHIFAMRSNLARVIGISVEQINISATTTEQLGIIGEEKGIAASASCLLD